nr:unnamed protein product [Digitaria exilis]
MQRTQLQDEEFQESDILWPDAADFPVSPRGHYAHVGTDDGGEYSGEPRLPMKLQLRQKASSPIDIPGRKKSCAPGGAKGADAAEPPAGRFSDFGVSLACFGGGAGSVVAGSNVFVPPHVTVDRRAKREKAKMMFVVPSGRARVRKMRD